MAATNDVVNIFNFAHYIDSNAIPAFEKRTGVRVNYDIMDSNDVLEGKLLAGKSGYDVVVATSNYFAKQVEAGLYQPIPKQKLKNFGNLDPIALAQLESFDPGNVHGVPYMWGTTGVAFNIDMIRARIPNAPLDSWKMIFDPAFVSKFEDCGVAIVDDSDAVTMAALFYLGRNPNAGRVDELKEAIATIARIQPYVRYFHTSAYVDDLANGEICLALGYSGDVYQATRNARPGTHIEYRIPQEGAAVWLDVMAIPKDAPHPENAMKWIDHILEPAVVAGISNAIFYANPNKAAKPLLAPTIRDNPIIYPSEELMTRLVVVKPQSQAYVRVRNRGWTQAKAGM